MPKIAWLVLLSACAQGPAQESQTRAAVTRDDPSSRAPVHVKKSKKPPKVKCKAKKGESCTVVGSDGGTVAAPDGTTLTIPPGALPNDAAVTVAVSPSPAPAGALSPRYTFSPAGTQFTEPVEISIPVPAGTTNASLYWTNAAGTGFDRLGGTISGGALHAKVVHFSDGYVAPSDGSPLHVTLSLVWNYYVAGVLDGQTFPPLAPYTPTFYTTNGSGLTLLSPQPTITQESPGHYGADLPADTTSFDLQVNDYLYGNLLYVGTTSVDIGTNVNGPVSAATPPVNTTSIHVVADGLSAFDGAVDQAWVASTDGAMIWQVTPDPGASGFDVTVHNPDDFGDNALIHNQELDVAEVTTQSNGSVSYQAQTLVYGQVIDQTDGSTTQITAHLATGQPHTTTIDVYGTEFATMLGLDSNGIYQAIGANTYADVVDVADVDPACAWLCAAYSLPNNTDQLSSALGFVTARPLEQEIEQFEFLAFAFIQLPGTSDGTGFLVSSDGWYAPGSPIRPQATPVTSVHFQDSQDASQPASGVGLTPTVSWTGTADHYLGFLYRLDGNAGNPTTKTFLATFTTNSPSLEIPPGMLQSGETYILRVTTEVGIDLQRALNPPFSRVRWLSAPFTP